MAGRSLGGETLVARRRGAAVSGFLISPAGAVRSFATLDLTRLSARRLRRDGIPPRYAGRRGNRRGRYVAVIGRLGGRLAVLGSDIVVIQGKPSTRIIGLDLSSVFTAPLRLPPLLPVPGG